MQTKQKKHGPAEMILNIVIAVQCVILAILGILTVSDLLSETRGWVDSSSYYWRLEDDDFAGILNLYYYDTDRPDKDREYLAIAKYFEAAVYYHAFEAAGDTQTAQKYRSDMEQAAEKMDKLSLVKDKIDAKIFSKRGEEK